ncbi:DUF2635 domain-containing protein [Shewanella sp. NIFS-20-20]|uniref:DUF2635 domain-containing protein n=1 Tax=Shewanella sp. NIFS-20-20 TaxID=2853806 RepID=UPI001C4830DF|nr:DUF2635 domain-containing protein [Shewanella sp. NIFS-20-20]MBV7315449.1 DUF2635 domain-containing protein [Shewanella sp. NIFS-20-20]
MLINLKPAKPNVPVRKPDGGYLATDGEAVKRSSYWVRRINDGDVIQFKAAASAKKSPANKAKAGE